MTTSTRALPPPPNFFKRWLLAMRPKTLPAAVVPVFVGSCLAARLEGLRVGPALAALFGALLLQIGSNFANDVFDYEKGADNEERLGPQRAVQAGWISPRQMRGAMWIVFLLAALVGAYLTVAAGFVILGIGVASILSAIAYTGGPFPLGYHGLGDVFVLIFFGFVAVCGTAFVNLGWVPREAWWLSLAVGSLATAILVVNNVRDFETDEKAGKRTLVVRLGRSAGLIEYRLLLAVAFLVPAVLFFTGGYNVAVLLPLATLPLAYRLDRRVNRERGTALNQALAGTARLLLAFGVLLGVGLVLGGSSPT